MRGEFAKQCDWLTSNLNCSKMWMSLELTHKLFISALGFKCKEFQTCSRLRLYHVFVATTTQFSPAVKVEIYRSGEENFEMIN